MAKIKLTKSTVDAAEVTGSDYELRDTIVPGFLCKVTAHGRKVFMLRYRTNWGERRKPKIGQFGELTVEQARSIAQDWLADVRKGNDPSAAKLAARMAPTVKELCGQFIEEYSKPRNKPRTVDTYQGYIDRHIVPALGKMKVPDVTRTDITTLMRNKVQTAVTANRLLACLRKMFNMAEVWGYRPDGSNQMYQDAHQRWQNTLNGLQTAMQMQAQVSQNVTTDQGVLTDLVSQSQSATGALQAQQATNQLLALQAKQSIQAQQLQLTQGRASALELARQAAAVEQGRVITQRFLGTGTPYTPETVSFYGN